MNRPTASPTTLAAPLLLTVALTALAPISWGTTYAVTTEFLPADRPLFTGLIRALPAGLVLLAVARKLPSGVWWWKAAALGALNIGAFFPLLFLSAYRLPGGAAVAYWLWFRGIGRLAATQVTFLGPLSPLTAAVVGWTALGQSLGPVQLAGMALAFAATVAGQLGPRTKLRERPEVSPAGAPGQSAGSTASTPAVVPGQAEGLTRR